jgi:hypothetical protein
MPEPLISAKPMLAIRTASPIVQSVAFRWCEAELRWHEQIFQIEQFAQGTDNLDSFLRAAHGAKPLVHFAPWWRPSDPHGAVDEGSCLGERAKRSWFRRILDHERWIDAKVEHPTS